MPKLFELIKYICTENNFTRPCRAVLPGSGPQRSVPPTTPSRSPAKDYQLIVIDITVL